jgi:hypothetical protein
MGHNNVIYGGIEEIEGGHVFHQRRLVRNINERAIKELPSVDSDSPPLSRSMFTIPKLNSNHVYRSRIITFGVSFNCVYFELDEWFNRFECLLQRMYWSNVTMFIKQDIGESQIVSWRSRMWDLKLLPVEKDVKVPPTTSEWERVAFKPRGEFY